MHRLECRLMAEAISVHQESYHRDDCRRDWSRLDLIEVWLIDWGASLPLDASRLCRNHRELVSCGDSTRNTPCLKPACIALAGLWRVGCTRFACCFSLKNFLFPPSHPDHCNMGATSKLPCKRFDSCFLWRLLLSCQLTLNRSGPWSPGCLTCLGLTSSFRASPKQVSASAAAGVARLAPSGAVCARASCLIRRPIRISSGSAPTDNLALGLFD